LARPTVALTLGLMEIRSLGLRTDLRLARARGQVDDRGEYLVLRTPDNPSYWYGNSLLFPAPPAPGDLPRWMELYAREHGTPESSHRVFLWDAPDGTAGACEDFLAAGFVRSPSVVLTATAVLAVEPTPGILVRRLSSADDWRDRLALTEACHDHEGRDPATYRVFRERHQALDRKMIAAGDGDWWGAFDDGRLVGDLGLFFGDEPVGRFQSVQTHPSARRRGICRTLMGHVAAHALAAAPGRTLVIIADEGQAPQRIYERVGFRPTEHLVDLHRPPSEPR